jgi:hypothetical protein
VFPVAADTRPNNEDQRPAEIELRKSLEMAIEGGGVEKT